MRGDVPNNFVYLLSLNRDCKRQHIAKASTLKRDDIDSATDPEVLKLRRMVNAVMNEMHLMRAFVRLTPLGDRILYGKMKVKHNIGGAVARLLAKRNPGLIIVVGSSAESWTALYWKGKFACKAGKGLTRTLNELKEMIDADGEEPLEDLWDTYYWSQYCDKRKNIRYFNSNMPKMYRKAARLKTEKNTRTKSLLDYD